VYKQRILGLLLLGLLTIVLTACSIREAAAPPSGPTVKLTAANFVQDTITIKQGESITFLNETTSPHVIENGTWKDGVAQPEAESGAPAVNMNIEANESATTPPFETAGTFKLYCPIHPGMNLTVMVE
jgi:plastocyanin